MQPGQPCPHSTHVPVEPECNFRLVIVEVMCADAGKGLHIGTVILEDLSVVGDRRVQVIQTLGSKQRSQTLTSFPGLIPELHSRDSSLWCMVKDLNTLMLKSGIRIFCFIFVAALPYLF